MLDIKIGYTTTQVNETETLTSACGCCYIQPKYRKLFTPEIERWINNYFDKEKNSAIINNQKTIVALVCNSKFKCLPEDKFDKYVGGKISLAKGKIKIYRFMKNLCNKIIAEFLPLLTGTDTTIYSPKNSIIADYHKYEDLESKEIIYLKKLINK